MPSFFVVTMMPDYVLATTARSEIRVANSRFIASAAPAATVEAARAFIAGVRAEMPDASHHVYAYIIGHGNTVTLGMSDDGEPSGTAGRPVMGVVKGSGLGDVAVVVTRYFGGTLLGTGGLVHAYGDAAKAVLAITPRAEKIERRTLVITVDYPSYEQTRRVIAAHTGTITNEAFAADVMIEVSVPLEQQTLLMDAITALTAGAAQIIAE